MLFAKYIRGLTAVIRPFDTIDYFREICAYLFCLEKHYYYILMKIASSKVTRSGELKISNNMPLHSTILYYHPLHKTLLRLKYIFLERFSFYP